MMKNYSVWSTIFALISLISIISLIILIIIIIRSPSYLTKWTLFQLCVVALIYNISTLPTILIYGDDILEKAFTTNLCSIQFRITLFFFYPLNSLPIVLSFYLFGLLKKKLDLNIEKKWYWTLTTIIWTSSLSYNSLILTVSRNDKNDGVMVTRLYCDAYKVTGNHYWIYQLIIIIFLIATTISLYSATVLYRRWNRFEKNQSRMTAIKLGYAVRICIYMVVYTVLLGCYIISDIIQQLEISKKGLINYGEDKYHFGSFTLSTTGIFLLLIFGGNRTAAICLPFCYYVPPNEAYRTYTDPSFTAPPIDILEIIINDNNNNNNEEIS